MDAQGMETDMQKTFEDMLNDPQTKRVKIEAGDIEEARYMTKECQKAKKPYYITVSLTGNKEHRFIGRNGPKSGFVPGDGVIQLYDELDELIAGIGKAEVFRLATQKRNIEFNDGLTSTSGPSKVDRKLLTGAIAVYKTSGLEAAKTVAETLGLTEMFNEWLQSEVESEVEN